MHISAKNMLRNWKRMSIKDKGCHNSVGTQWVHIHNLYILPASCVWKQQKTPALLLSRQTASWTCGLMAELEKSRRLGQLHGEYVQKKKLLVHFVISIFEQLLF